MHEIEGLVDLFQRHGVGDQVVDLDLALHVPVDDLRYIGAAAGATKGGAAPDRPVTSWKGRVEISWPAPATPMMMDSPQPLWQHSSASRMSFTLPMHSKV